MPVTGRAQHLQIHRVVHTHASRALDQRFNDHRGDLGPLFRQDALQVCELALRPIRLADTGLPLKASGEGTVMTSISSGW